MKKEVVAPCGIECFNCEMYEENVTEEFQKRISENYKIPKEEISCKGCIDGNICLFLKLQGKECLTRICVDEKGVDYCFECDNFPCEYLMPLSDRAKMYPHNMKVYNLALMKKIGVEAWKKEAKKIRKIYFEKPIEIGSGGKE